MCPPPQKNRELLPLSENFIETDNKYPLELDRFHSEPDVSTVKSFMGKEGWFDRNTSRFLLFSRFENRVSGQEVEQNLNYVYWECNYEC